MTWHECSHATTGASLSKVRKKSENEIQTVSQTCDDPSGEVDVDDAGGEGGHDHSKRGKEAAHHHHWTTAEAVNQHTAERTCIEWNEIGWAVRV